jgi:hypothetical protein
MSGRITVAIVDFPAFLSVIDRVRCVLFRSFLVRNWCGPSAIESAFETNAAAGRSSVSNLDPLTTNLGADVRIVPGAPAISFKYRGFSKPLETAPD